MAWPVIPSIPGHVSTGGLITAAWNNQHVDATAALWTDLQSAIQDPTTSKGDLLVRGAAAPVARLPVGADGQVLVAASAAALGIQWATISVASLGAVPSSRQVIAGAGLSGGGALSADVTLTANVRTVFGRTGAIVATAGDYTAALVTNAADMTQSYPNPTWITSLAASKLTGAPPAAVIGATQTPWLQNIDGGNFQLANVSKIGIGTASPATVLHCQGTMSLLSGSAGSDMILNLGRASNAAFIVIPATAGGWLNSSAAGDLCIRVDSQKILFGSAGNLTAAFLPGGNVGIGTASPGFPLDVVSNAAANGLNLRARPDGWLLFQFSSNDAATNKAAIQVDPANNFFIATAGTERMRITSAGNVGIGTANPKNVLTVNGNGFFQSAAIPFDPGDGSGPGLRLGYYTAGDYGYIVANNTGVAGKNLIFQPSGGNVGIFTPTPQALCQIGKSTSDGAGEATAHGQLLLSQSDNQASLETQGCGLEFKAHSGAAGYGWKVIPFNVAAGYDLAFATRNNAATWTPSFRLLAAGGMQCNGLPSVAPAAGSKQLWFDPADGNRVKFAA